MFGIGKLLRCLISSNSGTKYFHPARKVDGGGLRMEMVDRFVLAARSGNCNRIHTLDESDGYLPIWFCSNS